MAIFDLPTYSSSDSSVSSEEKLNSVPATFGSNTAVQPVETLSQHVTPPRRDANILPPKISPHIDDEIWSPSFAKAAIEASETAENHAFPTHIELARALKKGKGGLLLDSKLQGKWTNSTENAPNYEKRKNDEFQNMLNIVAEYGGPHLKKLAVETRFSGVTEVPFLIEYLRSCSDREAKIQILDSCLKIYVDKSKQSSGGEYATGTMRQKLKLIFSKLNKEYTIGLSQEDFPTVASFRSVLSANWNEAKKNNPDFGVKKPKSQIELEDVAIVYDAIKTGLLAPKENPYHLRLIIEFILLRLFGLRSVDVERVTVEMVEFKVYDFGIDKGRKYCQIFIPFHKSNLLKLRSKDVHPNYGKMKVRDCGDPVFNAYELIELYCSKIDLGCGKKGLRFIRHELRRRDFDPTKETTWYRNANVGKNQLTQTYRRIGEIINCKEFSAITSHGGRACLITYSKLHGVSPKAIMQQTRHKDAKSMEPYDRITHIDESNFQDAITIGANKPISTTNAEEPVLLQKNKTSFPAEDAVSTSSSNQPPSPEQSPSRFKRILQKISPRRNPRKASLSQSPTNLQLRVNKKTKRREENDNSKIISMLREQNSAINDLKMQQQQQEQKFHEQQSQHQYPFPYHHQQHQFSLAPQPQYHQPPLSLPTPPPSLLPPPLPPTFHVQNTPLGFTVSISQPPCNLTTGTALSATPPCSTAANFATTPVSGTDPTDSPC